MFTNYSERQFADHKPNTIAVENAKPLSQRRISSDFKSHNWIAQQLTYFIWKLFNIHGKWSSRWWLMYRCFKVNRSQSIVAQLQCSAVKCRVLVIVRMVNTNVHQYVIHWFANRQWSSTMSYNDNKRFVLYILQTIHCLLGKLLNACGFVALFAYSIKWR